MFAGGPVAGRLVVVSSFVAFAFAARPIAGQDFEGDLVTLTRALVSELGSNPLKGDALVARSGVPIGIVRRAQAGRAISADSYLRLCAALGVRPFLSATRAGLVRSAAANADRPGVLSFAFLGMATRLTRTARGHNVRAAAEWSGVSAATISRVEAGVAISIESVVLLAAYVGAPASQFVQAHPLGVPIGAGVSRETSAETG